MAKNMNTATADFLTLGASYEQGLKTIEWASGQSELFATSQFYLSEDLADLGVRLVETYDDEGNLILAPVFPDNFSPDNRTVVFGILHQFEDAHARIGEARKHGERMVKRATGMVPEDLVDAIRWYQMTRETKTCGTYTEERRKPAKDGSTTRDVVVKRCLEDVLVELFQNLGMGNVTGYTAQKFGTRFIERVYTGKCSGKVGSHAFKPVNKKGVGKDCLNILLDVIYNGSYRPERNDDGSFVFDEQGNKKFVKCGGGYHLERGTTGTFATLHAQNQGKPEDNGDFALTLGEPADFRIVRNA